MQWTNSTHANPVDCSDLKLYYDIAVLITYVFIFAFKVAITLLLYV